MQLFVQTPGQTIYFVLFLLLCCGAFLMIATHRSNRVTIRRYRVALGVVCGAWLIILGGAVIATRLDLLLDDLLPMLEVLITLLTLIVIGWSFAVVPPRQMIAHAFTLIAALLVIVAVAYAGAGWLSDPSPVFVESHYALWWFGVGLSLSVGLLVWTATTLRDSFDMPLKVVALTILAIAYAAGFINGISGVVSINNLGLLRLAYVAFTMVVTVLVYRSIVRDLKEIATTPPPESPPSPTSQPTQTRAEPVLTAVERESVQLMRALGIMLEGAEPRTIPKQIFQAVVDVLRVDVVVLLHTKDANYADVQDGHDRFMSRDIAGMSINLNDQPHLASCITGREQVALKLEEHEDELQDLYTRLDIDAIGPTYLQPMYDEDELIGVLLVGLPYSQRELARSEEGLLRGIGVMAANLLRLSYAALDAQQVAQERAVHAMMNRVSLNQVDESSVLRTRHDLQENLRAARGQIGELGQQVLDLKRKLEQERGRIVNSLGGAEETLSASQQITTLDDELEQLRLERDAVAARLQEAQAALRGTVSKDDLIVYHEMLETLQTERDDLLIQRDTLQTELESLRGQSGELSHPADIEKMLGRMQAEAERLTGSNETLRQKLAQVYQKLRTVGFDAEKDGLSSLIQHLSDERDDLIADNEALQRALTQLEGEPASAPDERLQMLQMTLHNVAADREAALKQRDRLRRDMNNMREKLHVLRLRWKELEGESRQSRAKAAALQEEKTILRAEILRLNNERSNLVNVRDRLLAERQALETEREQLLARIDGDRSRVESMSEAGVGSLTQMIRDLSEQREALEVELNEVRQNLANTREELERARPQAPLTTSERTYPPQDADLLLGIVQEFRTPMTSIVGYVDLLLSESAGILGEMQRKFLQRVHTNVQRLETMLDDFIRVTEIDTGTFDLLPAPVNVTALIEDAITQSANRFREKELTVSLMIENDLPSVYADKDALTQVITQLITNAYLVSPPDSEIVMRVEYRKGAAFDGYVADALCFSVKDRGGGIAPDDEPRVFSRKYRADNALIQGLGDTGVGLSVARALTQAQGGRLWLETELGIGTQFSFMLPLSTAGERQVI
ncbi:MAG: hypothetical protein EA396_13850 [Anaerolineaceae bacterium]|nr:MAG: hypothetical protein EA396_13850 [Anaerolineaceae bacterium]